MRTQLINVLRILYFTVAPVNCGDPGVPENGWRLVRGTTEPSTVEYSCVEGYALNGTSERTCTSTGEWSGALPSCQSTQAASLRPSVLLSQAHPTGGAIMPIDYIYE